MAVAANVVPITPTRIQTGVSVQKWYVNGGNNKISVIANGSTFQVVGYSQPEGTPNRIGDVLSASGSADFNGTALPGYSSIEVDVTAFVGNVESLIVPTRS